MLDETTDHSNKSILMLLVMYINSVGDIIVLNLDLITIAIPPALPSTLTVSIIYAVHRLK